MSAPQNTRHAARRTDRQPVDYRSQASMVRASLLRADAPSVARPFVSPLTGRR